ncbi:MAG: HNH endonuclease [Terriglobia bacterium]|jgi:5-methylcytosine-specific restriction endonuclease McrA
MINAKHHDRVHGEAPRPWSEPTHPTFMHTPVLVLNATYEPINICAARRALVLVLKGVARAEEEHPRFIKSPTFSIRIPSVIRLLEFRHIPRQSRALSRKNILMRDRNTCQYCGGVFSPNELTLDHVAPRSLGGTSTWENLVACCKLCNHKKGNLTLAESGLRLFREPRSFNLHTSRQLMRMIGHSDEQWRKYLFY